MSELYDILGGVLFNVLGVTVFDVSAEEMDVISADDSEVDELCKVDGTIFSMGITSGLKGYIPVFRKPALIFGIEKERSNGTLSIRANSRFDTTKFFFVNDRARTALEKALEKVSFKDLNTATSNG